MTPEFNRWWNADELMQKNPYRKDTPIWWAWEGWQAAQRAEMSVGLADPHKALIDRALVCYVENNEIDKYEESIIIGVKRKLGCAVGAAPHE